MRARPLPMVLLLCVTLLAPPVEAAPRTVPSHHTRSAGQGGGAASGPPSVLLEVSTGKVLQAGDPHRRIPPASLDKLMTLYLTLQAIRKGRLTLDTPVTVSAQAWRVGRTGGSSRMFLNAGDVVTVRELLGGLMVASGNDAAEALAEAIGGSSEGFVAEMNAEAARLGMHDTHYVTPHGLPAPDEYTSAWDVALISRRILLDFPDIVQITRERYETYGGIRQANWNNLVFRDPSVDGLKTGHTAEAGYSIAATAEQGGMRLLVVVMDAPTLKRRTDLAEGLLHMGFSRYELAAVPWQKIVPAVLRVYGGTAAQVPLETAHPVTVLLERETHTSLRVSERITVRPVAPIGRGQQVGLLTVSLGGREVASAPIVAGAAIGRGGLVTRAWGLLRYAAGRMLHRHPVVSNGTYTLRG